MRSKPILTLYVGVPCSGKSTKAAQVCKYYGCETIVVSRDTIRDMLFGLNYKPNVKAERRVTEYFDDIVKSAVIMNRHMIFDNTHCKQKYINEIIRNYGDSHDIRVEFFDISFIKACYRNIMRYFSTGKWIPWKVMYHMHKNYKLIDRSKYE